MDEAHESWKQWFQQHGPRLLLCARQWTRTVADAEDPAEGVTSQHAANPQLHYLDPIEGTFVGL